MADPFHSCLISNVSKLKGYGTKRIGEASDAYIRIRDSNLAAGELPNAAGYAAMTHVLETINSEILRKQVTLRHNIDIMASADLRMEQALTGVKTGLTGKGGPETKLAMAMRSFDEDIRAMKDAPSIAGEEHRLHGLYHGRLTRVAPDVTVRGKFGVAPAKQQQADLISEWFGGKTGNAQAAAAVKTLREIFSMSYATQRSYGAKVRAYDANEPLPIGISPNKLLKQDGALSKTFAGDHKNWLDFDNMRWPDGRRVLPSEQDLYLNAARQAITSGGKHTGQAKVWGDDFDAAFARDVMDQRAFRYKDATSWQAAHDKYADGDTFTTMISVLTQLVRDEAKIRIYGPNPDRMVATIASMAQKKLSDRASTGDTVAERAIPRLNFHIRRYHQESVQALRNNAMDPNSKLAVGFGAASDLARTAQLGSALVANVAGDVSQMVTLAMAENRGMHDLVRTLAEYVKNQAPGQAHASLLDGQRFGVVYDDIVFNDVQTTRMDLASTISPKLTKGWGRFWTMAGGVPRHTNALRASVQTVTLMDLAHFKTMNMAGLPEAQRMMLARAGITDTMWDEIRVKMTTVEVRPGVHQYDPIQSYSTMPAKLAERMHRVVVNEVNGQVLMPTNEMAIKLRGSTRPDTLGGALLGSFAMYGAQPIAASYNVMRAILNAQMTPGKRVATYATYGIMMIGTGALGLQIRAVIAGRQPEDMLDPAFWGRAAIAGGAFNIWGGYLTNVLEEDSARVLAQIAGPIAGFAAETAVVAWETASQMLGISDDDDGLRHLITAVERYIGPKPFYAAAILNREVWERLKEMSDRSGYRRSVSTRINNSKKRGQTYHPGWQPSDRPVTDILSGR